MEACVAVALQVEDAELLSYKDALSWFSVEEWNKAMQEEMKSVWRNLVWD